MDSLIIFCAKYLFILVVLLYIAAFVQASPRQRKAYVVALVIAGVVAVVLDKLCGKLYYDPRPFVSQHYLPLIQHAADNGFPSEHTVFCMTIAALLTFYRRGIGIFAILVALIVGLARIDVHVHSPIDILAGVLIGIIAASVGYYLTLYLVRRRAAR